MSQIDWQSEVYKRKDEFLNDLQGFLQIKSVLDEEQTSDEAPFGQGVKDALEYMLDLGKRDGFNVVNTDNLAGHVEMGEGEGMLGMLGHADVVPEGDGWQHDPYSAVIQDGKIYARGAIDDKGPSMAAYYAMKIVHELGLPLNKRVRLIMGTDEESDWRGVHHYFNHEEMPDTGFVPDADFPIIFAEKGLVDFDIVFEAGNHTQQEMILQSFHSGLRYNMVPDHAEAQVIVPEEDKEIIPAFDDFLAETGLNGGSSANDSVITLTLEGQSAHGAEPSDGINAGIRLAEFLKNYSLDETGEQLVQTIAEFHGKTRGEPFNIAYHDDVSGDLTMNVGVINYSRDKGGRVGVNMRYPVTFDMDEGRETLENNAKDKNLTVEISSDSKPAYVEQDDPLIQTLQQVYEEQTGEKADLLAIGGGTYARSLDHGVAFGALFPGREDVMHQTDEYAIVDDLLKATAIYAQAIYELAKSDA